MRADEQALASLASSVADGAPVDWDRAAHALDDRSRRLVRHLRLVESISTLHRTLPAPDDLAAAPGARQPDGPRWGRLVLLDRIGEGTSCHVYRAWDTELHRDVAVKLFLDDGPVHARVLEEGRRLARVRHPHVVHVYGAETQGGRAGLWMELVRGESLETIVKTRGPLGAQEALLVGFDLCAALAAVHGAGLLHRDIKAQNVMREEGGRIVLMDFGTGEEQQQQTGSTRLVGTPLYLAPEIFRGEAATVRSDIYALGVLLFYLVTGEFPVVARTMPDLAKEHAEGRSRRLRDLRPDAPEAFVRVVERALDREPGRRFDTAGEMEAALRRALDREEPAPALRHHRRRQKVARRVRPLQALIAVGLLAAIAALLVWSFGIGRPPAMRRMAVLPIADMSGPTSVPFFAEGLTNELISTLGQIDALQVTPRASVARLVDQGLPPSELARRLQVDGLLESKLVVSPGAAGADGMVTVDARILSAGGAQVWTRTFTRTLGETSALQGDIARAVAKAVRVPASEVESARFGRTRQVSFTAQRAYNEGLHHMTKADSVRLAFDAFRRAIALDPNFAAAHAGLARTYLLMASSTGTISQPEARAQALAAATTAVSLDSESSEAHSVLADLKFMYDWDWAGAEEGYRRAVSLNPSNTYARERYARFLGSRRRLDEALREAERCVRDDPSSVEAHQVLALVRYFRRDYPGALGALATALDQDRGRPGTYLLMSRVNAARGAIDEAIRDNESAIQLSTQPVPGWRVHLLMLQAMAGRHEEVRAALATRQERAGEPQLGPQQVGYVYAALGDTPRAMELLRRALDLRDPDMVYLAVDPRVDSLRNDPQFVELLGRIGMKPTP